MCGYDLSFIYSVIKVTFWNCVILTAPAAIPPECFCLLCWHVLSKHHAKPFVADTVTLWLLLPTRRSRSWSADRSKWESCPTNRDKYTLPLFSFTLVFPTLLEPPCCSKASSEEMTDHIKRLAVALTGVLAPAFRREETLSHSSGGCKLFVCLLQMLAEAAAQHIQIKMVSHSFWTMHDLHRPYSHQMLQRNAIKPVSILSVVLHCNHHNLVISCSNGISFIILSVLCTYRIYTMIWMN